MIREHKRETTLPAFSLDLAELDTLWTKMLNLFESPDCVYGSIKVVQPLETLTFSKVSEIKQELNVGDRIVNFEIFQSQKDRNVFIRRGILLGDSYYVRAWGDSDSWCAGAVDVISRYAQSKRTWYSWIPKIPLLKCINGCNVLAFILLIIIPRNAHNFSILLLLWLSTLTVVILLFIVQAFVFHPAIVVANHQESFIKRHATVLGFLLPLIIAIVGLLRWVFSWVF